MLGRIQKSIAVFIAVLLMTIASAGSANAGAMLSDLENALMCKCDDKCGKVLENCTCSTADGTRRKFAKLLESGLTVEQIIQQQVEEHGETVLSAPTKKGFNLTAWVMPFVALLVGGVGLRKLINGWIGENKSGEGLPDGEVSASAGADNKSGSAAGSGGKYSNRLQDELKRLET